MTTPLARHTSTFSEGKKKIQPDDLRGKEEKKNRMDLEKSKDSDSLRIQDEFEPTKGKKTKSYQT